ncbi:Kinesin-related motor protein [Thecaphora frezii]
MEGDLTSQMGTYSSEAGIIPRTLYRLFHTLELSKEDYSVRASFIELYNEELRDLLSADPPTPLTPQMTGNSVNGGNGGKDQQQGGLRMFDDAKGRGVVIQGLEEIAMTDAEHGLNLLRRGSQKRQIAATKCNENSSRSHSVFTMTVHIKDTGSKGEDVLKIGKLNLVDLAGSENIGRSGAENKRAREAGMINQSLLTLGRVINALVEKNSHIPYRESKLTRLLQESLGGRTKTCIIATVSQEKANMEETLSTLDYALRAKSIRNRPELNTRMNRSALIKEYVSEIERLKADLTATREQNGIYLDEANYKHLQDESEQRKQSADELRRTVEVTESKLTSLKEQFEQNMQLLLKRDSEVRSAKAECAAKTAELASIISQINSLEKAIEEETALKRAYRDSEDKLNDVASSLKVVAQQSTADVSGLFAKLERKTAVEVKNRSLASECQTSLSSMIAGLEGRVTDHRATQERFLDGVASRLSEFARREEKSLSASDAFVQQSLAKLSALAASMQEGSTDAHKAAEALAREVDEARATLQASTQKRVVAMRDSCRALLDELVSEHGAQLGQVQASIGGIAELIASTTSRASQLLASHRQQIVEAKEASKAAAANEIAALQSQNELLAALVQSERAKGETMRQELASNIGTLLLNFTEARDRSLTDSVSRISTGLQDSQQSIETLANDHASRLDGLSHGANEVGDELDAGEGLIRSKADQGRLLVEQATASMKSAADRYANEAAEQADAELEGIAASFIQLEGLMDRARQEATHNAKRNSKKIKSMNGEMAEAFGTLQKDLRSTAERIASTHQTTVKAVEEQRTAAFAFLGGAAGQLSSMRAESRLYLSKRYQDAPTGETPKKRKWSFPHQWSLVPSKRDDAIQAGRLLNPNGEVSMQQDVEAPVEGDSDSGDDEDSKDDDDGGDDATEVAREMTLDAGYVAAEDLSQSVSSIATVANVNATAAAVPTPAKNEVDEDLTTTVRRSKRARPLQELAFGHNQILTPSASEEGLDIIKALKAADDGAPEAVAVRESLPPSRIRPRRAAAAVGIPVATSKRTRHQ